MQVEMNIHNCIVTHFNTVLYIVGIVCASKFIKKILKSIKIIGICIR